MAAQGLLTLGELSGREEIKEAARRILEAFAPDYPLFSFHAAPYARSVDLLLSGFLTVTLLGERESGVYTGLKHAAFLSPLPRLLVMPGGNNQGVEGKASMEEGAGGEPETASATVCTASRCELATGDPELLAGSLEVKPGMLEFEYREKGEE
jgi:uncharacterized protein YyaL (SSP411 family)